MPKGRKSKPLSQPQVDAGGSGLPDAERFALLQYIMSETWVSEADAKEVFEELRKLSGGGNLSYSSTVNDINESLQFLFMGLKTIKYPIDNQRYIGYVNKQNDEVAKANGTSFSIPQVQYFRGVVEAIAQDPDAEGGVGTISSIDAMNINFSESFMAGTSQPSQGNAVALAKPLSMQEKDAALNAFVRDGWLSKTPELQGHYSIGVRSFMELGEQLLDMNIPNDTRTAWEQLL